MVARDFPRLPYAAVLLGSGSEVFGFDDPVSTDHDWMPRVILFLKDEDFSAYEERLRALFQADLPELFRGYPVRMYARTVKHARDRGKLKFGDPRLEPRVELYTITLWMTIRGSGSSSKHCMNKPS